MHAAVFSLPKQCLVRTEVTLLFTFNGMMKP